MRTILLISGIRKQNRNDVPYIKAEIKCCKMKGSHAIEDALRSNNSNSFVPLTFVHKLYARLGLHAKHSLACLSLTNACAYK